MRLAEAALAGLSGEVERFGYDRAAQAAGIVHIGIGAFHRAHQAWYTDLAMDAGDRDWAITGVSLRSADVASQMNPQDGLYTVTEQSGEGCATRLVGAVRRVLVAPQDREAAIAAIAAPETRIVSLTITEKGYCRAADGSLDFALADERSAYGIVAAALGRRKAAGSSGLTLLSCDNLAQNGDQLDLLMRAYLDHKAPDLLRWFESVCTCPSTMIDRIVPATTAADRVRISGILGMEDHAAVVTEPFSQWVIEDRFAASRPRWDAVGAQFVADVEPYETAKLRMLNGAHSALAYLGLAAGHEFVHQAVADPMIAELAHRLMVDEAASSLTPAPGQDLDAYAAALLARFANPSLNHRLAQIAMDGSQKIPQRWLTTLAHHQRAGRQCPSILTALGAWLRHIRGDNGPVDDPLADVLKSAWQAAGEGGIVDTLLGAGGMLASDWRPQACDRALIPL